MTLDSVKDSIYAKDIRNYKFVDPYDNDFYKTLNIMQRNKTPIQPIIEESITKYKIDKIKEIELYNDRYDINIKLCNDFKKTRVQLSNPINIEKSEIYDEIPDGVTFKNTKVSAYYQYKFKNKTSNDFLLSNLDAQNDIPNELNYLVMNEQTDIPIPELKRQNLDREQHLKQLLSKHERKQSKYTDTTPILQIENDDQLYNRKLNKTNIHYEKSRPSTYNKPVIRPVTTGPVPTPVPVIPVPVPVIPVIPAPVPVPVPVPVITKVTKIPKTSPPKTSPPKILLLSPPSTIIQSKSTPRKRDQSPTLMSPISENKTKIKRSQSAKITKLNLPIPPTYIELDKTKLPPSPPLQTFYEKTNEDTGNIENPIKRGRKAKIQGISETNDEYNKRQNTNAAAVIYRLMRKNKIVKSNEISEKQLNERNTQLNTPSEKTKKKDKDKDENLKSN